MNALEYFRSEMKESHKSLLEAVRELTDAQLHFRPLGLGNPIAFIFWHYVRTEDIIIHLLLQNKKPVWNTEGWDRRFGMDPKSQGTGMTADQAAAIRIANPDDFLKYANQVFQASEAYLETVKAEALDEVREFPALGKRSVAQVIGGVVLNHGAGHLGEIWYAKGLQGLKGSPI
jgi:hypothetical protein